MLLPFELRKMEKKIVRFSVPTTFYYIQTEEEKECRISTISHDVTRFQDRIRRVNDLLAPILNRQNTLYLNKSAHIKAELNQNIIQ